MAILNEYAKGQELSRKQVQDILRKDYGDKKAFKDKIMDEAIMTSCGNELIHKSKVELDENGELVIYFQADEDERAIIRNYIKEV